MNLKSKIISLVFVLSIFMGGSVCAQGFFKNSTTTAEEGTTTGSGVSRTAPGFPDEPPGETASPVGEGLLILSLLSGGYFMVKKKNSETK